MEFQVLINTTCNLLVFVALLSLLLYFVSKSNRVVNFVTAETAKGVGVILVIITLGIAIMLASSEAPVIAGAKVNVRDSIAVFAAIVGGPIAGVIVGLIGGLFRFSLGGWTALPCSLATILAGIIAAAIVRMTKFRPKNINAKSLGGWIALTVLWEIIHLQILIPLLGEKPYEAAFTLMAETLLIPMVAINALGIGLLLFLVRKVIIRRQTKRRSMDTTS